MPPIRDAPYLRRGRRWFWPHRNDVRLRTRRGRSRSCLSRQRNYRGYLPLAATLVTEKVYAAFLGNVEEDKTFYHGHTYTGNQLSCSVALKNIELIETRGLLDDVQRKARRLAGWLERLYDIPIVGDIRQKGLMCGIEIVKNRRTKEVFPRAAMLEHRIILEARRRGLVIRPLGPVLTFIPVLAMSEAEMEEAVRILYDSIVCLYEQARAEFG